MDRRELMEKMQEIFSDVFGNPNIKINEETNASDIEEWDSLTNITILAVVQDEFSVSFELGEIVSMKNVGEMVDAILEKM